MTECETCPENNTCWNLKILKLALDNGVEVAKIHCPKGEFVNKEYKFGRDIDTR